MAEMSTRTQEEERNFRFEVRGRWDSEKWEIRIRLLFRTKFVFQNETWVQEDTRRTVEVTLPNCKERISLSWAMAEGLRDALEEVLR